MHSLNILRILQQQVLQLNYVLRKETCPFLSLPHVIPPSSCAGRGGEQLISVSSLCLLCFYSHLPSRLDW